MLSEQPRKAVVASGVETVGLLHQLDSDTWGKLTDLGKLARSRKTRTFLKKDCFMYEYEENILHLRNAFDTELPSEVDYQAKHPFGLLVSSKRALEVLSGDFDKLSIQQLLYKAYPYADEPGRKRIRDLWLSNLNFPVGLTELEFNKYSNLYHSIHIDDLLNDVIDPQRQEQINGVMDHIFQDPTLLERMPDYARYKKNEGIKLPPDVEKENENWLVEIGLSSDSLDMLFETLTQSHFRLLMRKQRRLNFEHESALINELSQGDNNLASILEVLRFIRSRKQYSEMLSEEEREKYNRRFSGLQVKAKTYVELLDTLDKDLGSYTLLSDGVHKISIYLRLPEEKPQLPQFRDPLRSLTDHKVVSNRSTMQHELYHQGHTEGYPSYLPNYENTLASFVIEGAARAAQLYLLNQEINRTKEIGNEDVLRILLWKKTNIINSLSKGRRIHRLEENIENTQPGSPEEEVSKAERNAYVKDFAYKYQQMLLQIRINVAREFDQTEKAAALEQEKLALTPEKINYQMIDEANSMLFSHIKYVSGILDVMRKLYQIIDPDKEKSIALLLGMNGERPLILDIDLDECAKIYIFDEEYKSIVNDITNLPVLKGSRLEKIFDRERKRRKN